MCTLNKKASMKSDTNHKFKTILLIGPNIRLEHVMEFVQTLLPNINIDDLTAADTDKLLKAQGIFACFPKELGGFLDKSQIEVVLQDNIEPSANICVMAHGIEQAGKYYVQMFQQLDPIEDVLAFLNSLSFLPLTINLFACKCGFASVDALKEGSILMMHGGKAVSSPEIDNFLVKKQLMLGQEQDFLQMLGKILCSNGIQGLQIDIKLKGTPPSGSGKISISIPPEVIIKSEQNIKDYLNLVLASVCFKIEELKNSGFLPDNIRYNVPPKLQKEINRVTKQYQGQLRKISVVGYFIDRMYNFFAKIGLANLLFKSELVTFTSSQIKHCRDAYFRAKVLAGDVNAVHLMLDHGFNLDKINSQDHSLVVQAAAGGNKDMVDLLLSRGLSANQCSVRGASPLMAAIEGGHLGAMELLLERGADPNKFVQGTSPLNLLVLNKNAFSPEFRKAAVELLLKHGANPKLADSTNKTPLQHAARFAGDKDSLLGYMITKISAVNALANSRATQSVSRSRE